MESIEQKYQRLKDELKKKTKETKENLILAKKIYLKRFELENGLT